MGSAGAATSVGSPESSTYCDCPACWPGEFAVSGASDGDWAGDEDGTGRAGGTGGADGEDGEDGGVVVVVVVGVGVGVGISGAKMSVPAASACSPGSPVA
ncbi:hypothetical protein ESZ53_07665 [Salinibacterium sp. UTAS2018]|uniref:hypothetical protein n=1 Tax=Salinibacterium sp. UTAS2018 TaxID=2508880 RepID=UPI0010095245|nr:hypothetical protein [Salinibacterium sp. UTAS2018]QAV70330.1 hypothetical protein ESZ53_07665 [Salinibacterium sp. UTAS2018]